jgi:hypothetical protein
VKNAIKSFIAFLGILVANTAVSACPWCRAQVRDKTYNQDFFSNLFLLLLPIILPAAIGFGLYHFDKISNKIRGVK